MIDFWEGGWAWFLAGIVVALVIPQIILWLITRR